MTRFVRYFALSIIWASTAMLLLTTGLFAQEGLGNLPAVHKVTGVASDDVLNVRADPESGADIVGALKPDEAVEVTGTDISGKWARIITREGNGWIFSKFLKKINWPSSTEEGFPLDLQCGGTEPFWNFDLSSQQSVSWSQFGGPPVEAQIEWTSRSVNSGGGSFALKAGEFSGVLLRYECSDGMSDRTYGWQFELIRQLGDRPVHYSGCCRWNK